MKKLVTLMLFLCVLGSGPVLSASDPYILGGSSEPETDTFSHITLNLDYAWHSNEAWSQIITSQSQWEEFYQEMIADYAFIDADPAPEYDFDTYQMIIGGIGYRSHGGDRVLVEKVTETNTAIIVSVLVISSGSHCVTTAVIDYPSAAVLIKKSTKPVQFSVSEIISDCSY